MPRRPLAKTQPQLGKGRIVSAKMTFKMPSTMNNTIRSRVSVSMLSAGIAEEQQADDQ